MFRTLFRRCLELDFGVFHCAGGCGRLCGRVGNARDDLQGRQLNRSERRGISASGKDRGHESRPTKLKREEFAETGALQCSLLFPPLPNGGFGNERHQQQNGRPRNQSGQQRETPGDVVRDMAGRKGKSGEQAGFSGGFDDGVVGCGDANAAQGSRRQRPADGEFAGAFLLEEFRQPGYGGDQLDAHADEGGATK